MITISVFIARTGIFCRNTPPPFFDCNRMKQKQTIERQYNFQAKISSRRFSLFQYKASIVLCQELFSWQEVTKDKPSAQLQKYPVLFAYSHKNCKILFIRAGDTRFSRYCLPLTQWTAGIDHPAPAAIFYHLAKI